MLLIFLYCAETQFSVRTICLFDAGFCKTSIIKNYNILSFFAEDEKEEESKEKKKKSEKPMLLKDYERQRLLEKGSKAYLTDSDSDGEEGESEKYTPSYVENKNPTELTYNQEQLELKKR